MTVRVEVSEFGYARKLRVLLLGYEVRDRG
jgi:hypothetical protein